MVFFQAGWIFLRLNKFWSYAFLFDSNHCVHWLHFLSNHLIIFFLHLIIFSLLPQQQAILNSVIRGTNHGLAFFINLLPSLWWRTICFPFFLLDCSRGIATCSFDLNRFHAGEARFWMRAGIRSWTGFHWRWQACNLARDHRFFKNKL